MSNNQTGSIIKYFFILICLMIILFAGWMMLQSITSTIQQTISPINQANQMLSTQVSELLHPTPTILPDPVTIIHEVRALARLETIQYSVEKVITSEVNQGLFGPLFGDKLLFVAHGIVIGGIDMSKINPEQMQLKDGILTIQLPPAEILITSLDNQKSYVYDRDTGLFTKGFKELETSARQAAEQEIHDAAIEDGILKMANQNAEVFLENFFNTLGYQDVVFVKSE
jgi:cell division protein FtsL